MKENLKSLFFTVTILLLYIYIFFNSFRTFDEPVGTEKYSSTSELKCSSVSDTRKWLHKSGYVTAPPHVQSVRLTQSGLMDDIIKVEQSLCLSLLHRAPGMDGSFHLSPAGAERPSPLWVTDGLLWWVGGTAKHPEPPFVSALVSDLRALFSSHKNLSVPNVPPYISHNLFPILRV